MQEPDRAVDPITSVPRRIRTGHRTRPESGTSFPCSRNIWCATDFVTHTPTSHSMCTCIARCGSRCAHAADQDRDGNRIGADGNADEIHAHHPRSGRQVRPDSAANRA